MLFTTIFLALAAAGTGFSATLPPTQDASLVRAAKRHPDIGGSAGGIAGGAKRFANNGGSVTITPFTSSKAGSRASGSGSGSGKRFADEAVSPGDSGSTVGDVAFEPWPFGW